MEKKDWNKMFFVTIEMAILYKEEKEAYVEITTKDCMDYVEYHRDVFKEQWTECFYGDDFYGGPEYEGVDFSDFTYEKLAEFQYWCRWESGNHHLRSMDNILFHLMMINTEEKNEVIFDNFFQFKEALEFCNATCEDLLDTFTAITDHH